MSVPEPTPAYRDASLPVDERIDDLLGRMTVAEKAGMLFQTMIAPGPIDEANPHS
jgi:beta-glucosidase